MAIHKAASREKKRMSLETMDRLSWWFGFAATVLLPVVLVIIAALAWYFSWKSSQVKDTQNAKLATSVQSMQQPVAFTAHASLKVKTPVDLTPQDPGIASG